MRNLRTIIFLMFILSLFFIIIPITFAQNTAALFRSGAIRVLILSGRNNHDWRTTTPFLKKLLLDSDRFDVRVNEEPAGMTAATLAPYDLLVLDYNGPRWGEVTEKAVEEFVKSGKGMVVIHGASWAFNGLQVLGDRHVRTGIMEPAWPEYAKMIGGIWSEAEPRTGHGKRHSFKVKFVNREHPIAQDMDETFIATDELYHNMRMQPTATILAAAYDDPQMGGTGKDEPILWTINYGKGRVFHDALGHDVTAMSEPGFITTFLRGCEWAATSKVTLPPKSNLNQRKPDALKILVVTGGHDFDTEFYTLFEGYDDLIWNHVPSNHSAFNSDIRQKFDVLVLYDLSNEISENEQKNLKDYVESGKGIVVLHHAIADYISWEWWYKEVVGGKYLLKPEGSMPASTYKHDEEMFVRPVIDHPITSAVGPLHLWDETYKGMWISPDVQVLLRTDNPTSDGPVAWISPYEKSRVVYIELGHDRFAHLYPAYRILVKRAILWSAGKLK